MVDFNARCDLLRELITSPEILVMPGAHDALTARILELEGYKAVQHSSWGVAAAYGLPDGYMSFSESLDAARHMVRAVDIPVNADAEGGFGLPAIVYRSVSELIQIGAVGLNLEDKLANPGEKEWKIIELPLMLEKIDAFMEAKRDAKSTFVLNARTDAMMAFSGDPKRATQEAIRRGNAFAEKGADLIFVFGKYPAETIQVLVKENSGTNLGDLLFRSPDNPRTSRFGGWSNQPRNGILFELRLELFNVLQGYFAIRVPKQVSMTLSLHRILLTFCYSGKDNPGT